MNLRIGSRSPAVRRLQEMLDMVDYDIVADGMFGTKTDRAVRHYQAEWGLKVDGIVGPITMTLLKKHVDELAKGIDEDDYPIIHDIRGKHSKPHLYKDKRAWSDIVGVTLHQTGCNMPKRPRGWSRLNAHIGITTEGLCIIANDPLDWIWHAQGLSKSTIGIEIEGNFEGVEGLHRTLWPGGGPAASLNEKMMAALDACFCWLEAQFAHAGQPWTNVHAHRQSSNHRRADPGEQIWKTVGMEWIRCIGGTDGGPGWKLKHGNPIPHEWDESRKERY